MYEGAAPYPGRYSQHQRELLLAGFLDLTLDQLQAGALRFLEDQDAGGRGIAALPGVEQLLSSTISALQDLEADRSQGNPGSAAASVYVQAIASSADATLHATVELVLGSDPLALPAPDPRTEGL